MGDGDMQKYEKTENEFSKKAKLGINWPIGNLAARGKNR